MVDSLQERFNTDADTVVSPEDFFFSMCNLVDKAEEEEPPMSSDSRKRDRWMHDFLKHEPHLAGVVSSTTSIDTNRGWKVVGGRNQVKKITTMMHNWECAPGLKGWRPSFSVASFSYRCSNLGTMVEMGRDGVGGPVAALYNVDPTKCRLTGANDFPIQYYPGKGGRSQKWSQEDFFRVTSMPSEVEEYSGLGYCPVDRCIRLAQLLIAVYRHDEEQLLARAPRGLLLLSGINRDQWDKAMLVRNSELDSDRMKYYGAVAVLASVSAKVDAKLLALSSLPTSFNLRDWMDMMLYGYSLCFGYDPSEFWPVQYGALGRGNETEIQHEKATGKGRLDFVLGFQEQFQEYLPDSIEMEFDQRDEQGDLLHAQIFNAWVTAAKIAYEAGSTTTGGSLLSRAETRVLLANNGVIPSSWSENTEVASTDIANAENEPAVSDAGDANTVETPNASGSAPATTKNPVAASPTAQMLLKQHKEYMQDHQISLEMRRRELLESDRVWSAAKKFPEEQIVEYEFTPACMMGKTRIIWDRGSDVLRPRVWAVQRKLEEPHEPAQEDRTILVQPNITVNMPAQVERSASASVSSVAE
jgi:hypothetical protein